MSEKLNNLFSLILCLAAIFTLLVQVAVAIEEQPEQQFEEGSVELRASANQNSFTFGEPIVFNVQLTNVSLKPVKDMWFSYDLGFFVSLQNEKGNNVGLAGSQARGQQPHSLWSKELNPQEKITTVLDIAIGDVIEASPYFLRGEGINVLKEPVLGNSLLKPGKYSAVTSQAYPTNPLHYRLKQWIRYTTEVPFEIRESTDREKAAYELFRIRPLNGKFPRDPERPARSQAAALAAYRELIEKYSDTPYAPYAQYYIARILQVQEKFSEAAAAYQTTLQKHPDFLLKADLLYYLAFCHTRAGDKAKARAVLATFKKEFPNHLVAPNIRYLEKTSRVEALEQELKQ